MRLSKSFGKPEPSKYEIISMASAQYYQAACLLHFASSGDAVKNLKTFRSA
jgi:hypothetical protein